MEVLKIENLSKRFDNKLVLDSVSFSVYEGEIFGLLGPNGAGKSTLINIVSGLLALDSGKITVCGNDIEKESLKCKSNIGVVFQDLALMEDISVYDNLEFFASLYGINGNKFRERAKEVLDVIGLKEREKSKVKTLSGGMKRRLNIAVAMMHRPKILIMDEPTVGVDAQSRNYIFEFIKKIARDEKMAVIYTTHYIEEIEELCKRVAIVDFGKKIAYGEIKDIKKDVFPNTKIVIEGNVKVSSLGDIEGIKNIEIIDRKKFEIVVGKEFSLGKFLNFIEKKNGIIEKINYEDVKLEDVFLTLTGKSLRDK